MSPCPDVALVDGFHLPDRAGDRRVVVANGAAVAAAFGHREDPRDRLMAGPMAQAYPD